MGQEAEYCSTLRYVDSVMIKKSSTHTTRLKHSTIDWNAETMMSQMQESRRCFVVACTADGGGGGEGPHLSGKCVSLS